MNADVILLLKILVGGTAALEGVAAAAIGFLASTRTRSEQAVAREWFRKKWSVINQSPWLTLPERVIAWLLALRAGLPCFLQAVLEPPSPYATVMVMYVFCTACLLLYVLPAQAPALSVPLFVLMFSGIIADWIPEFWTSRRWRWLRLVIDVLGLLGFGLIAVLSIVEMPVLQATFWMVYLSPFFFGGCVLVLRALWHEFGARSKQFQQHFLLLGFAFAASLSLTQISLFVGHVAVPDSWVPQTTQMFVSNGVFDSMTIVTTLMILERATRQGTVPVAVVLSLALASMFACGSLIGGLLLTERSLTLIQAGRVLIGRSIDGMHWDAGPYFWVMHSTFIPVLGYMGLVVIAWLAKVMLVGIRWILNKGAHEEIDGLAMTARFLALLAAISGAGYFVISL